MGLAVFEKFGVLVGLSLVWWFKASGLVIACRFIEAQNPEPLGFGGLEGACFGILIGSPRHDMFEAAAKSKLFVTVTK